MLRHVAMVAKFLDDNKLKTSLIKCSRSFKLHQSYSISYFNSANAGEISWVESKRTVSKDNFCVLFTFPKKRACEIRKFHVAGVQRWQRNVQNSVMHFQICCFVNKNLLLFCTYPSVAVVVGFVFIQK